MTTPTWASTPQERRHRGRQQEGGQLGRDPPEHGGAEEDAGQHLADDRGLVEEREQRAHRARGDDDDGQREQDVHQRVGVAHAAGGAEQLGGRSGGGRRQRMAEVAHDEERAQAAAQQGDVGGEVGQSIRAVATALGVRRHDPA